ncbi:MAG: hypothetical protein JWM16_6050 [Verrucomicrobiales bacterium]|nr:hypothetical protein [Verrucomicrobiales bacterium]
MSNRIGPNQFDQGNLFGNFHAWTKQVIRPNCIQARTPADSATSNLRGQHAAVDPEGQVGRCEVSDCFTS